MRFVDLFAGLGGFHEALSNLGHECVFACESDSELRKLYRLNYPDVGSIQGDIRDSKDAVPEHEILCAGFPCQPFSKSGTQIGLKDKTHGTLFHEIVDILARHHPRFVILENVGNFALGTTYLTSTATPALRNRFEGSWQRPALDGVRML